MRMFVALTPSAQALEHLEEHLEPRRDAAEAADLRWAAGDQLHVTLAFLAEVPERRLDELLERLERAATRRTPFTARLAGGGAFPDVARARVLWAGLELEETAAEELRRLATGARAAASKAGIAVEGRRFRPHLTLARTRRPTQLTSWVRLLDAYRGPDWRAEGISLVESHLGEGPRGRPRHEVVADFPLAR